MKRYTHHASIYGIPVFYNVNTSDIEGKNWFFDWLIGPATTLHNIMDAFCEIVIPDWAGRGFPIKLIKRIE